MAEFWDRVCDVHPTLPRISVHLGFSAMAQFQRGKITAQQARDMIAEQSGAPLGALAQTELQDVADSITTIPVTGTAVQIADGRARRALRIHEINEVALLAGKAPYDDPAFCIASLALPVR